VNQTPNSTLADPQQIIADLQRELAECRAERDEALARRPKRRIKTQTVLPSAETAAMLFWALLAAGQVTMHKVDGWQTLTHKLADEPIAHVTVTSKKYIMPIQGSSGMVRVPKQISQCNLPAGIQGLCRAVPSG
jgi:hypothetical protein